MIVVSPPYDRTIQRIDILFRAERISTAAYLIVAGMVGIRTPLPHVSGHVVEAVSIGRITSDWGEAPTLVVERRHVRFMAGMTPVAMLPGWIIPPRVVGPLKATPRGFLSLRFGGQPQTGPDGEGDRIDPVDADDRVTLFSRASKM